MPYCLYPTWRQAQGPQAGLGLQLVVAQVLHHQGVAHGSPQPRPRTTSSASTRASGGGVLGGGGGREGQLQAVGRCAVLPQQRGARRRPRGVLEALAGHQQRLEGVRDFGELRRRGRVRVAAFSAPRGGGGGGGGVEQVAAQVVDVLEGRGRCRGEGMGIRVVVVAVAVQMR